MSIDNISDQLADLIDAIERRVRPPCDYCGFDVDPHAETSSVQYSIDSHNANIYQWAHSKCVDAVNAWYKGQREMRQ